MPTTRKRTAPKRKAAPKAAPKAANGMSASQKTIYNKLRKKGMSEKQASAFSHHAARRKDQAAAKKVGTKATIRKTATKRKTARKAK